jgi:hypothetical protein
MLPAFAAAVDEHWRAVWAMQEREGGVLSCRGAQGVPCVGGGGRDPPLRRAWGAARGGLGLEAKEEEAAGRGSVEKKKKGKRKRKKKRKKRKKRKNRKKDNKGKK